jgi:hypothetical protein
MSSRTTSKTAWGRAAGAPFLLGGTAIALAAILACSASLSATAQATDSQMRSEDPHGLSFCSPKNVSACIVSVDRGPHRVDYPQWFRDELQHKADALRARLKQKRDPLRTAPEQ